LGFESFLVPQHYNPSLVEKMVMLMQSSSDTTLLLGGDVSLDHVVSHHVQPMVVSMQSSTNNTPIFGSDASLDLVFSHPIQPTIEEVVIPMQYSVDPTLLLKNGNYKEGTFLMQSSVNPTLLLRGDASFNHVLNISSPVPFEQGSIPVSLNMLPPIPRMVSFHSDDIVEPHLTSCTPFQIRGIL
jgi:hypothetical protein